MWTAGHKYNWRKMEAAVHNRDEDGKQWSVAYVPLAATRLESSKLLTN